MSSLIQAQRGIVEHKLDAKGRVSIPLTWRPAPEESVYLLKVSAYGQPALRVLSEAAFAKKLQQIEEHEEITPRQKENAAGMLYANSVETKINEQGKLAVPKAWAEERELTFSAPVTLVGRGNYFELMSPENAEAMQAAEQAENASLNELFNLF